MFSSGSVAALVFALFSSAAFAQVTTTTSQDPTTTTEAVQTCSFTPVWNKCLKTGNDRFECASFNVPQDYSDPNSDSLRLNIIRYRAVNADGSTNTNANSIVVNYGGPGEAGIKQLLTDGADLNNQINNQFHIVSFDPRGVGVNGAYNCEPSVKPPPSKDFTDPDVLDAVYEYNLQVAKDCNSQYGTYGTLIGTVANARDVAMISEVVNADEKIRYWGYSYGTVLGDTIARLYPKRIAGMVLDGNINPNDYYLNQLPSEEASNVDAGIRNFFRLCADAKDKCDWTSLTSEKTEATLQKKFDDWVGANPTQPNRGRTSTLTNSQSYFIRNVIYQGIKRGYLFSDTATVLENWYNNPKNIKYVPNLEQYQLPTKKREAVSTNSNGNFNPADSGAAVTDNELTAITGSDNGFRPGSLSGATYGDWLKSYNKVSNYAGDSAIDNLWGYAPWIPAADETFTTPFADINTDVGILFVQTHYDPVTPDVSGQAARNAFTNSRIVYTDGVGHCSGSQPSNLLNKAVGLYWTTGVLPADNTNYPLNYANPFTYVPPKSTTDEDTDGNVDSQKRDLKITVDMWARAIAANPNQGTTCSGANTTTTTSSTTTTTRASNSTSTTTTTSTYIGSSNNTSTTTGTYSIGGITTSTSSSYYTTPTYTDSASTWLKWSTVTTEGTTRGSPAATGGWDSWGVWDTWNTKSTQSTAWQPWSSQSGNVPMTKTICYGYDCKTVVVAIPTVTTYVAPIIGVCSTGLTTSTVTFTATCAKGCDARPTGMPQGYTTTQVYCSACAVPSTVTVLVTVKNAATVTGEWSSWTTGSTSKIPADTSAKATGTDSWSGWATGAPGKSSVKDTSTAASGKPTDWANVPMASTVNSVVPSGTNWAGWSGTGTNPMIAKYTGGAVANALAGNGVLVAVAAAVLAL